MSFYSQNKTSTRSIETETSYLNTYRQLQNRCANENGYSTKQADNITPDVLLIWLLGRANEFSMSTWRQYKAAVIFTIQKNYPNYPEVIEKLKLQISMTQSVRSNRTSGKKLKCVPPKFWIDFKETLMRRSSKHRYAASLLDILKATLLTGLRPNEWFRSVITTHKETGALTLKVENSKNSNGRANGKFRELFINELAVEDRQLIKRVINYCKAQGQDMKTSLTALQNEFFNARKEHCEKNMLINCYVAMYYFRHQFLANAKKANMGGTCIAALVGHNSVHTATKHYGKRHSGNLAPSVTPTPESLKAVCNHGMGLRNVQNQTENAPITKPDASNTPEI